MAIQVFVVNFWFLFGFGDDGDGLHHRECCAAAARRCRVSTHGVGDAGLRIPTGVGIAARAAGAALAQGLRYLPDVAAIARIGESYE
jgi:hypothetical protein